MTNTKINFAKLKLKVNGYYNDPRSNPVNQKCLGDWMDPKVT
jgi:hypothetical protein